MKYQALPVLSAIVNSSSCAHWQHTASALLLPKFWNHFKNYPANSTHCKSILAGQNFWGHGKSNFLTKEEKRRSLNYFSPTHNSTFTKIVNLGIDGLRYIREYIRILGLRYIGKYWNIKPEQALKRPWNCQEEDFVNSSFHLAATPLDVRVSQAFVVERRNGKERSGVGPGPLTIAIRTELDLVCMLSTNRSHSLSGWFFGAFTFSRSALFTVF